MPQITDVCTCNECLNSANGWLNVEQVPHEAGERRGYCGCVSFWACDYE